MTGRFSRASQAQKYPLIKGDGTAVIGQDSVEARKSAVFRASTET